MVIDSLVHVLNGVNWPSGHSACVDDLVSQLQDASIDIGVIGGVEGVTDNEYLIDVSKKCNLLIACPGLDPFRYSDPRMEVDRLFLKNGRKLIKFHPRFNSYSPVDPKFNELLDWISGKYPNTIVYFDTIFNRGLEAVNTGDLLANLASSYPDLKFVFLHGGFVNLLEAAYAVRPYSNAIIDLSFTLVKLQDSSVRADIQHLLKNFDRRMSFGSDYPEIDIKSAYADFADMVAGIPQASIDRVLGGNLEEWLKGSALV